MNPNTIIVPSTDAALVVVEELGKMFSFTAAICNRVAGALRAKQYDLAFTLVDNYAPEVSCAEEMFAFQQLKAALAKVLFRSDILDPLGKATERYLLAEHRCKRTNQRLRAWTTRLYRNGRANLMFGPEKAYAPKVVPFLREITLMRRFIAGVIGNEPPSLDQLGKYTRFGPGSSLGVGGDQTHLLAKLMAKEWTVTRACEMEFLVALLAMPGVGDYLSGESLGVRLPFSMILERYRAKLQYQQEDRLEPVDKNAKTKRFIGVQPTGNTLVQLMYGCYMFDSLKRVGCDLRDQSRNQELARLGSLGLPQGDPWATEDLSMASDTVATQAVKLCYPPAWFALLNRLRTTGATMPDGTVVQYNKFSAMGNGFTFPLESLLFLAAVHVVSKSRQYSVYGDDIICRRSAVPRLNALLKFLGFSVNEEKSFVDGPFRESCGADFYEGVNVRPAYVKGARLDLLQLMGLHNRFAKSEFVKPIDICRRLREMVPPDVPRRPLPTGVDDGGALNVPPRDVRQTDSKWSKDYQGPVYKKVIVTPLIDEETSKGAPPDYLLAAALAGADCVEYTPCYAYRRRRRLKIGFPSCDSEVAAVDWGLWALQNLENQLQ